MLTEQGRANVFRVIGRDDAQGIVAGNYLADHWGDKKIAILHDNTTYGKGLADETRKQLNKRGVTEAIYDAYAPGKNDYSAEIAALQAADIAVVYVGGYHTEVALMVRACTRPRLLGSVRLGRCPGDRGIWPDRRPCGRGHPLHLLRRIRGRNAEAAAVVEQFRAENFEPAGYTLHSYAAVQIWAQAVEKAGSLELTGGDRVTARTPVRHSPGPGRLRRQGRSHDAKLGLVRLERWRVCAG